MALTWCLPWWWRFSPFLCSWCCPGGSSAPLSANAAPAPPTVIASAAATAAKVLFSIFCLLRLDETRPSIGRLDPGVRDAQPRSSTPTDLGSPHRTPTQKTPQPPPMDRDRPHRSGRHRRPPELPAGLLRSPLRLLQRPDDPDAPDLRRPRRPNRLGRPGPDPPPPDREGGPRSGRREGDRAEEMRPSCGRSRSISAISHTGPRAPLRPLPRGSDCPGPRSAPKLYAASPDPQGQEPGTEAVLTRPSGQRSLMRIQLNSRSAKAKRRHLLWSRRSSVAAPQLSIRLKT